MPAGSHKYFEQQDPHGGRISTDDPEFVAKVRAKLGPEYEHLVDEKTKSQAANIGRPDAKFNILGYYTPRDIFPSEEEYVKKKTEKAFKDLIADNRNQFEDMISPNKSVYGVGAGASPRTFAHEFRHKLVNNENKNRLLDVLSSNSNTDYLKNLQFLYADIYGKFPDNVPISELEKLLHNQLGVHNLLSKQNSKDYLPYIPHEWEDRKRTLENSGILSVLPDVAQQYIQRKAAMDRVAQPYLNFEGKEQK